MYQISSVGCFIISAQIPEPLRRQLVFYTIYHIPASGRDKDLTERFVWPSINKDCRESARQCTPCQQAKTTRHMAAPIRSFSSTGNRFEHVYIDIVGPLPISRGYRYCLTCVDRYTRWPELFRLIETSHLRTTAYHPTANGMAERLHSQFKAAIKCHETER